MRNAFICEGVRTPVGRYGGGLSSVRADDLGAVPLRALLSRYPQLDLERIDDVIFGCANQAGEDNRNVARMSALLAGLPQTVSGTTINRLCGSGARHQGRGWRSADRRWRRIHVPCAVRDGQSHGGVSASGGDLRHHHRLAICESAHASAIRN